MPFLLESNLKERGAIFSSADNWQNHVVVDGRLISGENPASANNIALEILQQLQEWLRTGLIKSRRFYILPP